MSTIHFETYLVASTVSKIGKNVVEVADVKSDVSSLKSSVDYRIRNRRSIGGRFSNVYYSLNQLEYRIQALQNFVNFAGEEYVQAEKQISRLEDKFLHPDKKDGGIGDFLSDLWGDAQDFTAAAWDYTMDAVSDRWPDAGKTIENIVGGARDIFTDVMENGDDYIQAAWHQTVDHISDTIDNAIDVAGVAWDVTSDYIAEAWDTTVDYAEAAWKNTVDWFETVNWGEVLGAAITIADGVSEVMLAGTLFVGSGAAAIFSGGTATPLAIAGMVGSGYLITDGLNKIFTGVGKAGDAFIEPEKDNWGDIPNIIEEGHKAVLGDQAGSTVYNAEQILISVGSLGTAAKNAPEIIDMGGRHIVQLLGEKYFDQYLIGQSVYNIAEINRPEDEPGKED